MKNGRPWTHKWPRDAQSLANVIQQHFPCWLASPKTRKPRPQPYPICPHTHPTTHREEDTTNLQELGMNLSGSQDKPTLALTIPRSNQVVYKGFPSATQFLSIQALPYSPLPDCTAFCTQAMIRTACAVYRQIQSRSRLQFRRSIQRGFRLRGVQPLSHA